MRNLRNEIEAELQKLQALDQKYQNHKMALKGIEDAKPKGIESIVKDKLNELQADQELTTKNLTKQQASLSQAQKDKDTYEKAWKASIAERQKSENIKHTERIEQIKKEVEEINKIKPKGFFDFFSDDVDIRQRESLIKEQQQLEERIAIPAADYLQDAIKLAQYGEINDTTVIESEFKSKMAGYSAEISKHMRAVRESEKELADIARQIENIRNIVAEEFEVGYQEGKSSITRDMEQAETDANTLRATINRLIDSAVEHEKQQVQGEHRKVITGLYDSLTVTLKSAENLEFSGGILSILNAGWKLGATILDNPEAAWGAISGGKKLKDAIEANLSEEDRADPNKLVQQPVVAAIMSDTGLFRALSLQRARVATFLDSSREFITKFAADKLASQEPSALTMETKLFLAEQFLNNEVAVEESILLAQYLTPQLQEIIQDKNFIGVLAPLGIKATDAAAIIPLAMEVLKIVPSQRENIIKVIQELKPVLLGEKDAKLNITNVLPLITDIVFGENGIIKPIAALLTKNPELVTRLANNKIVEERLIQLGIPKEAQAKLFKAMEEMLPVVGKLLSKEEELTRLLDGAWVMLSQDSINPKDVISLVKEVVERDTLQDVIGFAKENKDDLYQLLPPLYRNILSKELFSQAVDLVTGIPNAANKANIIELLDNVQVVLNKEKPGAGDFLSLLHPLQKVLVDGKVLSKISEILTNSAEIEDEANKLIALPAVQMQLKRFINVDGPLMLPPEVIKTSAKLVGDLLGNKNMASIIDDLSAVDFNKPTTFYGVADGILNMMKDPNIAKDLKNVLDLKNFTPLLPLLQQTLGDNVRAVLAGNYKNLSNKEIFNVKNLELANALIGNVVNGIPHWANAFSGSQNMGTIHKILKKIENDRAGVIQDNDITGAELAGFVSAVIEGLEKVNPAEMIKAHKQTIDQLLPLIPQEVIPPAMVQKLGPIVTDSLAELLKLENLKTIREKVLPNLPAIMEKDGKEQVEAIFKAGDALMNIIKSKEFANIYKTQIQPLVKNNSAELGVMIDGLKNQIPAMRKFSKVKGEEIVAIIGDEATLASLEKMYNHVKAGSYVKAAFEGMGAFFNSKEMRSVAVDALTTLVAEGLRSIFVPDFLRRSMIGDQVNCAINEGLSGKAPHDIAKIFDKAEQGKHGMLRRAFHNRDCHGLDLKSLPNNCVFDYFNLKGAKLPSSLEGIQFKGCDLSGIEVSGDLSFKNTKFDVASFKTLLPTLEKAKGNINVEGMLIVDLKAKDVQELKNTKFWKEHGTKLEENYSKKKNALKLEEQRIEGLQAARKK